MLLLLMLVPLFADFRNMIHSSLSSEELDIMCGVMSINGSCCRQPLTCERNPLKHSSGWEFLCSELF